MTILVTGGAGFIGSHVVDALATCGGEPVVLDDFSSGHRASLPSGVPVIEADIVDPAVAALVAGLRPDVIVHAAAQVAASASMADPARDRAVNVAGTAHVLAGAKAAGVRRFVFLSTGGVYGEAEAADERTLPQPQNYYAAHKYLAERYVHLSGLSYGIARLANVYGPRQRAGLEGGVVAIVAERLRRRHPITIYGTGEQRRDFVYVADVVAALLALLTTDRIGTWNVATGRTTSVNALLVALEAVIAPAVATTYEPARAGDIRASCLRIDRIREDLGWQPGHDLAAGVRAMSRVEESIGCGERAATPRRGPAHHG